MLLTEAPKTGMFTSAKAIRGMIERGELRRDVHWFQQKHRGRIYIDIDAVVEMITRPALQSVADGRIPVVGRTTFHPHQEVSVRGMHRN